MMIHKLSLEHLRETAKHRPAGYYDDAIASGRITQGVLVIEHEAYIALRKKYAPKGRQALVAPNHIDLDGAGTELKKLLSKIGLKPAPGCKCNTRIAVMNHKGVEWCEQNMDMITGWLKEEANRAKLPFLEIGAKMIIKRAIKKARKKHRQ